MVDLSIAVNSGTTYSGQKVSLIRNLDFTSDDSYENPTDTSYGDLNGDGTIEGIKLELTNEAGIGFTPIGTSSNPFKGTFEGNDRKIKNLYINSTNQYVGLFGFISNGELRYLEIVNGSVASSRDSGSSYVGAFVGVVNGTISNSYNSCKVSSNSKSNKGYSYVGGVAR